MGTIGTYCHIARSAHQYQAQHPESEAFAAGFAAGVEELAHYLAGGAIEVHELLTAIVPGIEITD